MSYSNLSYEDVCEERERRASARQSARLSPDGGAN
jgi:hypothetical protein